MKQIEKRILLLEVKAEDRRKERMKHEPFYEVVPWSIMRDEVNVYYYPEGTYKPPTKYENLPFAAVVEWAIQNCEDDYIIVSMDSCAEWLMLHTQNDYRYTEEQRKQSRERWLLEYPEIALLDTDEYWIEIRKIIGRLPQRAVFHRPQEEV